MRPTPYPQKRQPAKRIALKKHETLMAVKEKQYENLYEIARDYKKKINDLELRLGATIERLQLANDKIEAIKSLNNRERLIVNKLVGYEQD